MRYASYEKRETISDGRNRIAKSRKNLNARRKENVQILGHLWSWHHQTSEYERKKLEYLRRTRKLLETKLNKRNLIKGINTWVVTLVRYSGPSQNGPEKNLNKCTREQVRPYIPEMTLTDYICQEKKEEGYLPALKTTLTHQYNDLKTT